MAMHTRTARQRRRVHKARREGGQQRVGEQVAGACHPQASAEERCYRAPEYRVASDLSLARVAAEVAEKTNGHQPALQVADIFRLYGEAYRRGHAERLRCNQQADRALREITVCRSRIM